MNVEYPTSLPPGRYPSPNDSREVVSTPLNHRDEETIYERSHFETDSYRRPPLCDAFSLKNI